jgi:hypothetical protein
MGIQLAPDLKRFASQGLCHGWALYWIGQTFILIGLDASAIVLGLSIDERLPANWRLLRVVFGLLVNVGTAVAMSGAWMCCRSIGLSRLESLSRILIAVITAAAASLISRHPEGSPDVSAWLWFVVATVSSMLFTSLLLHDLGDRAPLEIVRQVLFSLMRGARSLPSLPRLVHRGLVAFLASRIVRIYLITVFTALPIFLMLLRLLSPASLDEPHEIALCALVVVGVLPLFYVVGLAIALPIVLIGSLFILAIVLHFRVVAPTLPERPKLARCGHTWDDWFAEAG